MFVVYQKSVRFLTSKEVAREIRDLTTNCSQWCVCNSHSRKSYNIPKGTKIPRLMITQTMKTLLLSICL